MEMLVRNSAISHSLHMQHGEQKELSRRLAHWCAGLSDSSIASPQPSGQHLMMADLSLDATAEQSHESLLTLPAPAPLPSPYRPPTPVVAKEEEAYRPPASLVAKEEEARAVPDAATPEVKTTQVAVVGTRAKSVLRTTRRTRLPYHKMHHVLQAYLDSRSTKIDTVRVEKWMHKKDPVFMQVWQHMRVSLSHRRTPIPHLLLSMATSDKEKLLTTLYLQSRRLFLFLALEVPGGWCPHMTDAYATMSVVSVYLMGRFLFRLPVLQADAKRALSVAQQGYLGPCIDAVNSALRRASVLPT